MGKEENPVNKEQEQQKQGREAEYKKKIIKKMPFKKKQQTGNDDGLKDWKPTKIDRKSQMNEGDKKQSKNIAESFLSSLSKPVNKTEGKPKKDFGVFDDDDNIGRKNLKPQINMKNLTEEQRKWDIEDQTFIRKEFIPKGPVQRRLEQQQGESQEEIETIRIGGKKESTSKVRHIDLNKIIDQDWQEELKRKNRKNELWEGAEGVLDGRGNLAKLAREALEKANDIDSELNKRDQERKQMRSRYGW